MPYRNEHAARIQSPGKYKRTRRKNNVFGKGVDVLYGVPKSGGSVDVQSIRFDADHFSIPQVKQWLEKHDFKALKLEPATRGNTVAKAIPANIMKRFSWQSPDGRRRGTFRANAGGPKFAYKEGQRRFSTARKNPEDWTSKGPVLSATLFVGFSVGDKPVWSMGDLITLVKKVRKAQVKHPDSSFLYQKGIYTHESDGTVVTEDGAQVIILNVPPMFRRASVFRKNMVKLAETICRDMQQETVIVRIDKNGIVDETIGVIA